MGWSSRWPSVWSSKYVSFFFHNEIENKLIVFQKLSKNHIDTGHYPDQIFVAEKIIRMILIDFCYRNLDLKTKFWWFFTKLTKVTTNLIQELIFCQQSTYCNMYFLTTSSTSVIKILNFNLMIWSNKRLSECGNNLCNRVIFRQGLPLRDLSSQPSLFPLQHLSAIQGLVCYCLCLPLWRSFLNKLVCLRPILDIVYENECFAI